MATLLTPPPEAPPPARRRMRMPLPARAWWPWIALGLVSVIALLALARTFGLPAAYTDAKAKKVAATAIEEDRKKQAAQPSEAAAVYARIAPSMVVIRTSGAEDGLGAGFVANADGRIVTANHVIHGASDISLVFPDGTKTTATVEQANPDQDIAIIRPATLPKVLVPAALAGPGSIGDAVYAVGHPLGLTFSLSAGVISGTGRSIETPVGKLSNLIQFDAAVNPGNSGGPLLNRSGQVIGVVTALANPSKQPFFVGIGFAMPISAAGGGLNAPPM